MTGRSRDQFRDGHRKTDHGNPTRWLGLLYAVITKQDGSTHLVGQWWDPDPAERWAAEYARRFPGTRVTILEAEFKDFYIPHRHLSNTEDVPTGDFL